MGLIAVAVSTFIVFSYLMVIWWLDRYEREPWWMMLASFAWGALGGTCLAVFFSWIPAAGLTAIWGAKVSGVLTTVAVAPLVEEFTKGLIFVPLFFTKQIDTETDGLMYGAATGLGFAAMENLIYYASAGDALYGTIILRTMFSTFVHCIASSMIGVTVGWARHRKPIARLAIIGGYVAAVLTHGAWNGLAVLTGSSGQGLVFVVSVILLIAAGVMMFALTQWMLVREHRILRRILASEASAGTLPVQDAENIPFWTRRNRIKGPRRDEYIRLATLLAFRRYQYEVKGEKSAPKALAEIEDLRQKVSAIARLT